MQAISGATAGKKPQAAKSGLAKQQHNARRTCPVSALCIFTENRNAIVAVVPAKAVVAEFSAASNGMFAVRMAAGQRGFVLPKDLDRLTLPKGAENLRQVVP